MFKIFKQELFFIPIMLLLMELFRTFIVNYYPETALFDKGSELENFLLSVWQIVWITSACWLLIAVVFPPAFRALKKFYVKYDGFTDEYKQGFALKLFACFFFGLVLLLSGKAQTNEAQLRSRLSDTLHAQLHVRELTGNNDGAEVERYLAFVGFKKGASWCAAFCSYNLWAVGVSCPPAPRTAWAPVFATRYVVWSQALRKTHKAREPQTGDCFTLFYPTVGRVGHVGFVVGQTDKYFITIEGNTGLSGSRDGSGVHKLKRDKDKVYAVANYITPYITEHEKSVYHKRTSAPAVFLQSQDHKGSGEKLRNARALSFGEGLYLGKGQICKNEGGQLDYHCTCCGGFLRQREYAGDQRRYTSTTSAGLDKERPVERKVQVQRAGDKDTGATAFNSKTPAGQRNEAPFLCRKRYKGGPLYPEMG